MTIENENIHKTKAVAKIIAFSLLVDERVRTFPDHNGIDVALLTLAIPTDLLTDAMFAIQDDAEAVIESFMKLDSCISGMIDGIRVAEGREWMMD